MRQDGLDIERARSKAAARLGLSAGAGNPRLPGSRQIQAALLSQRSLFDAPGPPPLLRQQRLAALDAMDFLQPFSPRLAGAVLDGNAMAHDPVCLHLHCDAPEEVAHFLHDTPFQARLANRALRLPPGQRLQLPCWLLRVDEQDFELWVLPASALRHGPLQALDDSPLPRAGISRLRAIIDAAG